MSAECRKPAKIGHFPKFAQRCVPKLGAGESRGHIRAVQFHSFTPRGHPEQIRVVERNAAWESLLDILPKVELPYGIRTVDGSLNNIVPTQTQFGAADTTFPRPADPLFPPRGGSSARLWTAHADLLRANLRKSRDAVLAVGHIEA